MRGGEEGVWRRRRVATAGIVAALTGALTQVAASAAASAAPAGAIAPALAIGAALTGAAPWVPEAGAASAGAAHLAPAASAAKAQPTPEPLPPGLLPPGLLPPDGGEPEPAEPTVPAAAPVSLADEAPVELESGPQAEKAGGRDAMPALYRPTSSRAWIARIQRSTHALNAPGGGKPVAPVRNVARWNGGPSRLLVLGGRIDGRGRQWLRVRLPRRPNGSSGWIPADAATVVPTGWRVVVSLTRRRVTLLREGRTVRSFRAVIGKPATPTPRGLFAISERIRQPSSDDFLGTWALLLTAFSPVLRSYGGGPGQVAIHGRGGASLRDPLGSARSHGCIRVRNADVALLARYARPGTPVQINP